MQIDFKYSLGDVVRTRRGDSGKIVSLSASEGTNAPIFRTYRLALDDGTFSWCPEYKVDGLVGW